MTTFTDSGLTTTISRFFGFLVGLVLGRVSLSSVISQQLESDRFITLENNYSVAYFFCDDKDDQLSSAHAMLANVLGQLLSRIQRLLITSKKNLMVLMSGRK
jgi:hypothetical protein